MTREGTDTRLGLHVYNRRERKDGSLRPLVLGAQWAIHPTVRGYYLGTLFKGWWHLGPRSINRVFEIEVAVGGEDNMLQAGIVLPFLARFHVGVRLPRRLTRGWVYHRREWTFRVGYVGRWCELLFASDEHMRDTGMDSYYRRKREQGEELSWSRAALWPGVHLTFRPRVRDRLLGRAECVTTTGKPEPVIVPMPEGNYPAMIREERRVWKRKRWPWPSKTRRDYWVEMDVAIPVPGKGENSWDCDDDAVHATGRSTPHDAVANVTRAALRDRANYGSPNWVPDAGWPAEIGPRA